MSILGIDYGAKRMGVAISYWSEKAKPVGTFSAKEVWTKMSAWIESFAIEKIIVGLPSGKMTARVKAFGKKLNYTYNIGVEYQDETLTSQAAKKLLIESGTPKRKRKKLIDAYSACLILEEYLRNNNESQSYTN